MSKTNRSDVAVGGRGGGPPGEPDCPGDPGRILRVAELLERGMADNEKLVQEINAHLQFWMLECPEIPDRVKELEWIIRGLFDPGWIDIETRCRMAAELREIAKLPLAAVGEDELDNDHSVVLHVLENDGRPMHQVEIAVATDDTDHTLSLKTVGTKLRTLEACDYVSRRSERKGYLITAAGRAWLQQYPPRQKNFGSTLFAGYLPTSF